MAESEMTPSAARALCKKHESAELWIICEHATPENSKAVLVADDRVTGEVLCPDCAVEVGADKPIDTLRVACGGCVRSRFTVVGGS